MFDVVAVGELLIDFTPCGRGEMGNPVFEMNPGGGPPNCLAAVSALGGAAAFIGKVGNDHFGDFLVRALGKAGIDAAGVTRTYQTHTTLAFVHLAENGERSFSFLRNPGADLLLTPEEIDTSLIDRASVFHFSSLSLTSEPARQAVLQAVSYAKQQGKHISYDPNYRPLLWKNEAEALEWMNRGLALADIVKLSEDELAFLKKEDDIVRGAAMLREEGAGRVFVTMGSKGAYYHTNERESGFVPAFSVRAVDTTGCGDAFMGAILYQITRETGLSSAEQVRFANATAALCATQKGGLPAMPPGQSVEKLLAEQG